MQYTFKNRFDYDLKQKCREYGFLLHPHFWDQSNDELLEIWNGIGAEGSSINPVIPDTVWGLDVSLASLGHDFGCFIGKSERDFHKTNLYLFFNMNQIVRKHSANGYMRSLRYLRTNKYYIAVESEYGWDAFRKGKGVLISEGMFDLRI